MDERYLALLLNAESQPVTNLPAGTEESAVTIRTYRKLNASDMLTDSPSAEELGKVLPMIGCHTMTANRENYNAVKTMLKGMPTAKVTAFLTSLADVVKS